MKVPEPKKLPSGNWNIRLRLGGEGISVTKPTKKECIRAAEIIKAEYRAGKRAGNVTSDLTLSEAIDKYIDARQNSLSPSTIRGYTIIQKNRFQEYMGLKLSNISDWQAVYDSEVGRLNGKTLKTSWALIRSVYKEQTGKQLPEIHEVPVVKAERPYLDPEEINRFLAAVKGQKCEIAALLALSSCRCSEILALTWDKVDLDHSRILIAGAVVPNKDNQYVSKTTNKTESSRRYIPIFIPQLTFALQNAREGSEKVNQRVVHYRTESGLLRAINAVCEGAGLPLVGVHGLRHSFASLCVHLKIPEETAMQIGGWSDFTTMRKIYTHISQRDQQKNADKLASFFKNVDENVDGI